MRSRAFALVLGAVGLLATTAHADVTDHFYLEGTLGCDERDYINATCTSKAQQIPINCTIPTLRIAQSLEELCANAVFDGSEGYPVGQAPGPEGGTLAMVSVPGTPSNTSYCAFVPGL
jgi:hypothetical protein